MNDLILNNLFIKKDKLVVNDILKLNLVTEKYGLRLTKGEVQKIIKDKREILKDMKRIEIRDGIIQKIILNFYDSSYIDKYNYTDTVSEIIRVFYIYVEEFENILTDDEIIKYMKDGFDGICAGSVLLLETNYLFELKENITGGFYG